MKTVKVIVGYTGTNYCAGSENVLGCVATGHTLEEVKKNYAEALDFHLEGMEEDNDKLPFKRGSYQLVFELNTQALLKAYQKTISFSALGRKTGINEKQLAHYANGFRKPKEIQRQKIIKGLHEIGKELCTIE